MKYIKARVKAEAPRERVERHADDTFRIEVREKAAQGLANARALVLLADALDVPVRRLRLVRGARVPNKLFLLN